MPIRKRDFSRSPKSEATRHRTPAVAASVTTSHQLADLHGLSLDRAGTDRASAAFIFGPPCADQRSRRGDLRRRRINRYGPTIRTAAAGGGFNGVDVHPFIIGTLVAVVDRFDIYATQPLRHPTKATTNEKGAAAPEPIFKRRPTGR